MYFLSILYLATVCLGANITFCDSEGLGGGLFELDELVNCLRTNISLLPDYGEAFYNTLVAWQRNNIYVDYGRDPSGPKTYTTPLPFGDGFDVLKEFENAKALFDSKTLPLIDFYSELQKSLIKLRDGHVAGFSPCLSLFAQVPPFEYKVLINSSGSPPEPYFVITAPESLKDKIITSLTWNGNDSDMVSTPQAFSDWAEKYSNAGLSPHGRFNDALIKLSGPGPLRLSISPLQDPATVTLNVSSYITDVNGNPSLTGTLETIHLEWLVIFLGESNDLSLQCPSSASSFSLSSSLPRTLSSEEQRIQNESLAMVEAFWHTLPAGRARSNARLSADELSKLNQRLRQRLAPLLERVREHFRHGHSQQRVSINPDTSKVDAGTGAGASAGMNSSRSTSSHRHALQEEPSNVCDFEAALETVVPTSDNMMVLCQDAGSRYQLTYIPAKKLARMYIGGFNPDSMEDYAGNLIGSVGVVNSLKSAGVLEDLIIDVRQNGGGADTATGLALKVLFPGIVNADSEVSVKLENNEGTGTDPAGLAKDFMGWVQMGMSFYEYSTGELVEDFTADSVTVTFENISGGSPPTYQRKFAKPYMISSTIELDSNWPTLDLSPQNIYLVSDGICASNCAVFSKKIRESRAARVLGYSRNPTTTANYALGSVPAFVLSSDALEGMRADPEFPAGADANFPPPPPTADSRFGISLDREFSLVPARRNEIIYLSGDTVDDIIPEFSNREYLNPNAVEGLMKRVHASYIATPRCFVGEVQVDDCTPDGSPIEHALYGRPCVANQFNVNQCVFSRCEAYYFQTGPATCSPMGKKEDGGDDGDDDAASIHAVTSRARVCVWVVLLGLLLWIVGM